MFHSKNKILGTYLQENCNIQIKYTIPRLFIFRDFGVDFIMKVVCIGVKKKVFLSYRTFLSHPLGLHHE